MKRKTNKHSVKNCKKTNVKSCKNNSNNKITGFEESKSAELENNKNSCESGQIYSSVRESNSLYFLST